MKPDSLEVWSFDRLPGKYAATSGIAHTHLDARAINTNDFAAAEETVLYKIAEH
jgi:hypothetical protein